jgi:hypothetical protein
MDPERKPSGAPLFYVGAFVTTLVSIDTSWRFFGERLGITYIPERIGIFAVIELILLACGVAMRGNVRRGDSPGAARWLAWALCGAAGYMAFDLAGPVEGTARVILGPVLAVVCVHLALGIEIKANLGHRTGTFARIGRELRERALSRLGLADDARDALARTRDRATERAARLATDPGTVLFRRARLAKAVRAAGVAVDEAAKARMLAHVAAYGNLGLLMELETPSPWIVATPAAPRPARAPRNAPTSGGPSIEWDMDKVVDMVQRGESDTSILDVTSVGPKQLQRTKRVVRAIATDPSLPDEAFVVPGNITISFVRKVREVMK